MLESAATTGEGRVPLQTTEGQALVVGSDVLAFTREVSAAFREDLVNSTLLGQLVASEKVPDRTQIFDWYDAYFDALAEIGWSVGDRDFAVYVETGEEFEAHAAIQRVLTRALGEGSPALGAVVRALETMRTVGDSPAVALFHRETRTAESAHFQFGTGEAAPSQEPVATLVGFALRARMETEQVLFLRRRTSEVILRYCASRIRIDPAVADAVRGPLAERLTAHAIDYVKALPEL
ncbi:MAG TPA: hypothetical protein VIO33_02640 [Burkholderiaceae bacterium]